MNETELATTAEPRTARVARHTLLLIICFDLLMLIWGVRCIWHTQESPLDFYLPMALWMVSSYWVVTDARLRRQPIPLNSQIWFFVFAPVAVPGYIIWTRGGKGLGWLVLQLFLGFVLSTVVMHLGGYLVYGDAWLRGLGLIA